MTDDKIGVVAFSGGKDSTAMLLRMLELDDPINYPVNRIVFCDTEFEFPALYEYLDRVQAYITEKYPERGLIVERINASKTWDDWFYGKLTRGRFEGQTRGAPLKLYPCYWSREAKIIPLNKIAKEIGCDYQYIGIAHDEQSRIRDTEPTYRYPLNEWKWTEKDCMDYLDHHDIALSLYTVFNRLGCFHCPKQSFRSWYSLWLHFPELYEKAVHWDKESIRLAGHGFTMKEEATLEKLSDQFKQGFIPKGTKGMECRSCSAVAMTQTGAVTLDDFFTDEAHERDPEVIKTGGKYAHLNEAEMVEWIPPSHANNRIVKSASLTDWFMSDIDENPAPEDCFDMSDESDTDDAPRD